MDNNPTITAANLYFSYGEASVLQDVSLTVIPGSILGIAGPNGSGKSTLVGLLSNLHRPHRGSIASRGPVALVVQRAHAPEALPLTVLDVVLIGTWRRRVPRRAAELRAREAIHRVGLHGLENQPFNTASGGQRQRALLAQALAQAAPTLILDEPTTGLDKESRRRMHHVLADEAARGRAVALVSHDDEGLAICDRVLRLESGHVVPS